MDDFARLLSAHPNAIFIWSMGLTQRANGVDAVKALINVALARGLPGRPNRGLVPIRGHSGVQGGAEVGCVPRIDATAAARLAHAWSFPVPDRAGCTTTEMIAASAMGDIDLFWIVGGNFLETLGDVDRSTAALRRPRLRVHQDIVLSSSMLVDSDGDVIILPSATRYESAGGGTETSTERRIIFSPEIPGRRIGSARPEWMAFRDVMTRAYPERASLVGLEDAAAIRGEIARAIPLYEGIERLEHQGDQIQWGGPHLFGDGRFATADGKAHFSIVSPGRVHPGGDTFIVSTRRGKQFNSMVQRDVDPLTGAARDAILISAIDLERLHLRDGAKATLRSARGAFTGRLTCAPIRPGNLEVYWPEGNALLSGDLVDPESMEPDYNAEVMIERASP
jgi:predicted molibdopterin-dependent oxidoreductase YjgC